MTAREVLFGSAFSIACTDSSLPPRKVHRKGNINSKDLIIPIQKTMFFLVPSSATSGDISVPSMAFILQHPWSGRPQVPPQDTRSQGAQLGRAAEIPKSPTSPRSQALLFSGTPS